MILLGCQHCPEPYRQSMAYCEEEDEKISKQPGLSALPQADPCSAALMQSSWVHFILNRFMGHDKTSHWDVDLKKWIHMISLLKQFNIIRCRFSYLSMSAGTSVKKGSLCYCVGERDLGQSSVRFKILGGLVSWMSGHQFVILSSSTLELWGEFGVVLWIIVLIHCFSTLVLRAGSTSCFTSVSAPTHPIRINAFLPQHAIKDYRNLLSTNLFWFRLDERR